LGSGYGGWWVPTNLQISPTSVCYSVGAGEDITFDIALVQYFGVRVVVIDPTPRARQHFYSLKMKSKAEDRQQISRADGLNGYGLADHLFDKLDFAPVGLWDEDRILKFYFPRDPSHVSCSVTNIQNTKEYFEAQCYSLKTLMSSRGDSTLSILKMDVEGAEHRIVTRMLNDKICPTVLLIEFDDGGLRNVLATCKYLARAGYRRVKIENRNVLFLFEQ
jgi:FkbM family methyltransferase